MFNPLAAKAVRETIRYLPPTAKTVIEFGNQRLDSSLEGGTVTGFYRFHGFKSYLALDVNQRMDAVVADLNHVADVIRAVAGAQFDLVTNNGTGEHIFDQRAVFESAHVLCKPGGIMLHVLPMLPWVNHGFYNYTPILFRDLALANEYVIKFFWIGDRGGDYHDCTNWPPLFIEKQPTELEKLIHMLRPNPWQSDLSIVCAFQKPAEALFRTPLQGKYVRDIEDAKLTNLYSR